MLGEQEHLSQYVIIKSQMGPELHYLNLRIIQSDLGISIDQTEHIQDTKDTIIDVWFPKGNKINVAYTPYGTDAAFERSWQKHYLQTMKNSSNLNMSTTVLTQD
jgi:hypothetical protein